MWESKIHVPGSGEEKISDIKSDEFHYEDVQKIC